jgi:hypothetical protein
MSTKPVPEAYRSLLAGKAEELGMPAPIAWSVHDVEGIQEGLIGVKCRGYAGTAWIMNDSESAALYGLRLLREHPLTEMMS